MITCCILPISLFLFDWLISMTFHWIGVGSVELLISVMTNYCCPENIISGENRFSIWHEDFYSLSILVVHEHRTPSWINTNNFKTIKPKCQTDIFLKWIVCLRFYTHFAHANASPKMRRFPANFKENSRDYDRCVVKFEHGFIPIFF